MEVVLDANVLFRTLISFGEIVELFFNKNLKIFAPEKLREEFLKNKSEIMVKSKLSKSEFDEFVSLIFEKIDWIPLKQYFSSIKKAKELLKGHEKDEEFIALCLEKNIKLWTYEELLFNLGFGISTKEISEGLSK